MSKSRRERRMFKLQSPKWAEAKNIVDNFVYDEKFNYTVYFTRDGKRKEESFEFHNVIKNEPIALEGDIDILNYTFIRYKSKTTYDNGKLLTHLTQEISEDEVIDELTIDRIEKIEKFDWTKAPRINY